MQRVFQQSYHVPGTLSANIVPCFTAPFNMQLVHVSAVASNASTATIIIGTTSNDDAYLTASDVGDSNVPAEFDRDDFVGDQYPHIADGDVVLITVDFNGPP
jgi:hypothetical protein